MEYTVFSCGVLYERFAAGGLAKYGMGEGAGVSSEGDYLVDIGNATGDVVLTNNRGQPAKICMTSVMDVARFVAAAVELGPSNWPREYRMRGDRLSVAEIVQACEEVRRSMCSQ
jgi:hypothetical protein